MGDFHITTSLSNTRDGCGIGANSVDERDRVRRYLANRVLKDAEGRWASASNELEELIDMLGLHTKFDDEATRTLGRASVRDCSPIAETITRRRARLAQKPV